MFSANNFWAGWFHQLRVNIFVIFLQILAGCLHHLPEAITNHMNCIFLDVADSMILVERTCDWNVETKNGESGESLKRSSCTCNVFFCVNFLMSTSFGKNVLTRVEYSQYKLFVRKGFFGKKVNLDWSKLIVALIVLIGKKLYLEAFWNSNWRSWRWWWWWWRWWWWRWWFVCPWGQRESEA